MVRRTLRHGSRAIPVRNAHIPPKVVRLYQFDPPSTFSANRAVSLRDAMDSSSSDSKKIAMTILFNWSPASAHQFKRALVDPDGETMGLLGCAGEVPQRCDPCPAPDKAPRSPAAGTSSALSFNEKLQVDLRFLYDTTALQAIDVYSKFPPLAPACSKYDPEAWDAVSIARIAILGRNIADCKG